jgi:hypothetical protein
MAIANATVLSNNEITGKEIQIDWNYKMKLVT